MNQGGAIEHGVERVYHDVDAAGNCLVPWCTSTTGGGDDDADWNLREHINVDRVLTEAGRYNPFKHAQRAGEEAKIVRDKLISPPFKQYVLDDADWEMRSTHDLTIMALNILMGKLNGSHEKVFAIGRERNQLAEERSSLLSYIWETFEERAQMLEDSGKFEGVTLIIALIEQLRKDLGEAISNEAKVTVKKVFPKGDHMTPQARRNVTLNDLHTMLQGMLLSGADVAVRDLHEYVSRHVRATHALVHTSLELEGYSEECCVGCREHGNQPDSVKEFLVWLSTRYTGDYSVSEKAETLLAQMP